MIKFGIKISIPKNAYSSKQPITLTTIPPTNTKTENVKIIPTNMNNGPPILKHPHIIVGIVQISNNQYNAFPIILASSYFFARLQVT